MFKKVFEFILFSNIFIALCAVSLCIETNILLSLPLNSISFYCFVFGATMAQYNFHYALKNSTIQSSQRYAWSSQRKKLHKILLGIGILLILFSFLFFSFHHFIILSFLCVIAFLYSFPVIIFGKKKRIKDFGFIKIMTLALIWTLVTAWLPVANFSLEKNMFAMTFFQRFIFMFIICLLFDLRDIEIDRAENINTVAVILGKRKSFFLIAVSVFFFITLSVCQYLYFHDKKILIAMLLSAVATSFAADITKRINCDLFYLTAIDGMLLLQAILVYIIV